MIESAYPVAAKTANEILKTLPIFVFLQQDTFQNLKIPNSIQLDGLQIPHIERQVITIYKKPKDRQQTLPFSTFGK
jgi:hypothetical protein